jgi:hypothetical protein
MHQRLTIAAVYGHRDGTAVIPALLTSVLQLPGSRALLLSPWRPPDLPSAITWRRIHSLNYLQYSVFVMHCLHSFIETDFCLLVQEDGWVINGVNFEKSYYDYDYIGAPCHAAISGNQLIQRFQWTQMSSVSVIQNGGFSLRSHRFLEAPNRLGIAYMPETRPPLFNEDIQLTGTLRPSLEAAGLRFAPDAIARGFAIEYLGPRFHDTLDFSNLVGHHARTRQLVAPKQIVVRMTRTQASNVFREIEFLAYLERIGYSITFQATEPSQ